MISIVGGGGKTTTMYFLADKYAKQGKKVIVTTSTHIRRPKNYKVLEYYDKINLKEEISEFFADNSDNILVIGRPDTIKNKLSAVPDEVFSIMKEQADIVIVEADGAKMLPIKVPKEHEPCIHKETDIFILVAGMDALGKRAEEICFRYERARELFSWEDEHEINEEDIINILSGEEAGLKGSKGLKKLIILNKADTLDLLKAARYIKEKIENKLEQRGEKDFKVYITSNSDRDIDI